MTLLYEEVYKDGSFSAICRKSSRCCMGSYNYNFISRNRIISEFGNTFYTVQGNEEFNKINVSRERRGRRGYYTISGLKYIYRSEEHTSELQSRFDLVCRLLLEKKNKK